MALDGVRVTVRKNPIPEIFALVKPPKTRELFRFIGAEVSRTAKDNARAHGGKRFWGQIANSVRMDVSDDGVVVGATHYAASHKQFGGTITAPGRGEMSRNSQFLTIPVDETAKRRNAGDFKNTFIQRSKKGNLLIFQNLGKNRGIRPLFVLKKSVTQKAYPWFPEGAQVDGLIRRGADKYFTKQITGG